MMRLSALTILITVIVFLSPPASAQSRHTASSDTKQNAAVAFEEGQNAQQRGDLNSAIRSYTVAISADPSLFQAYYQRATALAALGREAEAEADLKKVLELEPKFARAHRALGTILLDRGKTDEARRELSRAIELDPKITGTRIYYASALIKSGEPERALEHLRAAVEMNESPALAHALLGVALERIGKTDEASAAYSRAIELDTNNATAREGRARLLESKGDIAKAIENYSIAYRAQPTPDLALKLAKMHARAGQSQAAMLIYRDLLRQKPEDLDVRIEVAQLLAQTNQAEEAIKEVEPLLALRPNDSRLLAVAGDLRFTDKPEIAAEFYQKAIQADPANNRARVQLGAALVRSMRYDAALPVLAEAISREPNNYPAHANLATAHFKLKQYLQAAREFIWVVRARPEVAASYFFLAISFDRIGDCEQALRAYQEFVRRADRDANKKELEEASLRVSLLERLVKEGKCKPVVRGKEK